MNDTAEILNDVARMFGGAGPVPLTDVVLTWDEWPADSVPDAVDGSRPGTPAAGTATLPGLVHYVQAGRRRAEDFDISVIINDYLKIIGDLS